MLPTETGISSGPMSHLARMQTLPAYIPDAEFSASSLWCCSESKTQGKPIAKYVLSKPRLNEKRFHTTIKIILTLESRICQPPREMEIGFKNQFKKSGVKLQCSTEEGKQLLVNYWEVRKIEGSRKRDYT